MKKVVYSVSRFNKFGNNKLTGIGFITEKDLIIACVSQKGNAYIRLFEDCVKTAIPSKAATANTKAHIMRSVKWSLKRKTEAATAPVTKRERLKSNTRSGINLSIKETFHGQILSERISAL